MKISLLAGWPAGWLVQGKGDISDARAAVPASGDPESYSWLLDIVGTLADPEPLH